MTKNECDVLMNYALQYIQDFNGTQRTKGKFSYGEFTIEDLVNFKKQTCIKFDFEHKDQVALVPSVAYDILLCTEGDCNNYVHELLKRIKEKQTF